MRKIVDKPRFPLFIPTKGRADSRLTNKYLYEMGVEHYVVVEEQEYKEYKKNIEGAKIVVLDKSYQDRYETCDNLGDTKSKGPGAARNFIWDYSKDRGYKWHWVMDDNIKGFYRLNKNLKVPAKSGAIFKAMEDFCLRYENISMAGPNYFMFASRKSKMPPFVLNTRIYSCNLIRNDTPYYWRGRYNEDTDLSLRMLKDGWVTVQFNAFLQFKMTTQSVKGGNDKDFYSKDGTMPKSEMQVKLHPDVSRLVWKFNRWHHHVDYTPFKRNKLIKKKKIKISKGVDNYGMTLKHHD